MKGISELEACSLFFSILFILVNKLLNIFYFIIYFMFPLMLLTNHSENHPFNVNPQHETEYLKEAQQEKKYHIVYNQPTGKGSLQSGSQ